MPIATAFKAGAQYVLSGLYKAQGSAASGTSLWFNIKHTDDTVVTVKLLNNTSGDEFQSFSIASTAGKTVKAIYPTYNATATTMLLKDLMLNEGESALAYVPFAFTAIDKNARADAENTRDGLRLLKNDYADKLGAEDDVSAKIVTVTGRIDPTNGRYISGATGWSCSDYISIEPGRYELLRYSRMATSYTTQIGLAFYDSSSAFISGQTALTGFSGEPGYYDETLDVPPNAAFVRFMLFSDAERYGSPRLIFIQKGKVFKEVEILYDEIGRTEKTVPLFIRPRDLYLNTTPFSTAFETAADLYQAYETLLSGQAGTEMNVIGYATGTNWEDDTSLPLYEVVIKNPLPAPNPSYGIEAPTILLSTGLHADERSAIWSVYRFAASLLDQNNEIGSMMREAVTFKIVPLCNPWAYTNTGYTGGRGRYNARFVNLNRNFGQNWTNGPASPVSYEGAVLPERGPTPYSEKETQYLKAWLDAALASDHVLFHVDHHNSQRPNAPYDQAAEHTGDLSDYYFTYIATESERMQRIMLTTQRSMRRRLLTGYGEWSFDLRQWLHLKERNTIASFAGDGTMAGIEAGILETPFGFPRASSAEQQLRAVPHGTEILGNFIQAMLMTYGFMQ